MSDEQNNPPPASRDEVIKTILEDLEIAKRTHIRTRQLVEDVTRVSGQVEEIRTEQRVVLKELVAEQTKVLDAVRLDQAIVRGKLDTNTALTQEVRDILTTFKTLGAFAKWFGYIVAAVASAWIAIKGLRGG